MIYVIWLCVGVECRALCNDRQVFKKAEQLESQLAQVQFRTWRSGGETCHFNFNSNNLVPMAVPFTRTMDKRRAFQNWTLNVIENSNPFQPFVEKTLCHHLCEHSPGTSEKRNADGSHSRARGRRFEPEQPCRSTCKYLNEIQKRSYS